MAPWRSFIAPDKGEVRPVGAPPRSRRLGGTALRHQAFRPSDAMPPQASDPYWRRTPLRENSLVPLTLPRNDD